jgi:hypothetical protein
MNVTNHVLVSHRQYRLHLSVIIARTSRRLGDKSASWSSEPCVTPWRLMHREQLAALHSARFVAAQWLHRDSDAPCQDGLFSKT